MRFENQSTVALVTCDKGGEHQGEYISLICLNPICRNECLCCGVCKVIKHKDHQSFPLKTLFDDLEFKSKKLEKKSELMILSEIEKAQATSFDGIRSLQNYIQAKLQKMEEKTMNFFQNLKNETTQHFNNRPLWANEIEKLRFESDKDHLELKIQEILENISIGEGKILKLNEEFFGSKNTEPIDVFVKNLLETLKNIHASISNQYSKLYNPQSQPHNLKKDYFKKPGTINQTNQTNQQQTHVNGKAISVKNSEIISNVASVSTKNIQPHMNQDNLFSANTHLSNQNSEVKHFTQSKTHILSGFHNNGEQAQNSSDNLSLIQVKKNNPQQERIQENFFLQMQQSTVSQSISNVSQLQQMQLDIQKQINQQQQILQKLQAQTANGQQQSQYDLRNNYQSSKQSVENNAPSTLQSIVRQGCPSPPQRLMYYSSLFQQHVQNRQSQSPEQPQFQRFSSQPKLSLAPVTNQLNNSQFNQLNNSAGKIQIDRKSNYGQLNNHLQNDHEQDIGAEDFENQKFKDLPKSQERQFRFRFHKEYKHENIECIDQFRKVKGSSDNNQTRLALISPSVETKPHREFHWAVKIISCKSQAYSSPLAVGLCLKKQVENNQFKFMGEDKQTHGSQTGHLRSTQSFNRLSFGSAMFSQNASTTLSSNETSSHGCYLLTAAGFIRNHTEQKQDMKKVQVRFDQGDILLCDFNPFRKYLKIKNKNTGEYCMINIDFTPGDQLYPCVRISYCQDFVEILDEEQ